MNTLLSIVIPTYNRPEKIQKQVRLLIPQLTGECSLIVIDNHSNTPVESLFSDSEKKHFEIITNTRNIGGDGNLVKCFDVCNGKWLWTLSDDDPVKSDSVSTILSDIHKVSDNTVFINYDKKNSYEAVGIEEMNKHWQNNYWSLFWMSACLYNVELLSDTLYTCFFAVSTMQPGIVLLASSLLKHPEYKVVVNNHQIIEDSSLDICWSREKIIFSSMIIYDQLRDYRKLFNANLFNAVSAMVYYDLRVIYKNEKKFFHSIGIFFEIIRRRGWYNSLRYDYRSIIKTLIFFVANIKG